MEDVDNIDLHIRDAKVELLLEGSVVSTLSTVDTVIYVYSWTGDSTAKNLTKYTADDFRVEAGNNL